MQIARITSQRQYKEYKNKNAELLKAAWLKEKQIGSSKKNQPFTIRGFSYPAGDMVDFQVDYLYANGDEINWRERVICPITGLNNRLRACVQLIDTELGLRPKDVIYIAEQVTPLYAHLINKFPEMIGSEYLGEGVEPGFVNEKNIRHESATELSFDNESLDAYLSFECLEHIPDFKKAFAEAGRVLKKGGKFMWSVPFVDSAYENIIRAVINDNGQIQHILEPEYHGDPVSADGILCFTHFGWQMLDQIKESGFDNAYAFLYRSEIFGYFGGEQILFIAEKNPD